MPNTITPPASGGKVLASWGQAVTEQLNALPVVAITGSVTNTASIAAGATVDTAVTFPSGAFTSPPTFVKASGVDSGVIISEHGVSATGFTARCYNAGSSATAVGTLTWLAVA